MPRQSFYSLRALYSPSPPLDKEVPHRQVPVHLLARMPFGRTAIGVQSVFKELTVQPGREFLIVDRPQGRPGCSDSFHHRRPSD